MATFSKKSCTMVMIVLMTVGISAAPTPEKCPQFYYYDHGTDHCEHCADICDDASYKGTVDPCWKQCRPYALILWPPKPTKVTAMKSEQDDKKSDDAGLPLGGQIAIPVTSFLVILVVAVGVLYILRQRSNGRKNRRVPPVEPGDQTTGFLLGQTARYVDNTIQNHDHSFGVSSSTAGIQEEGAGCSGGGSTRESRVAIVAQASSSHQPVPVSPEGNNAPFAMALPRPVVRPPTSGQRSPSLADDSLNNTLLKTPLTSISDDSLFSSAHGGTTVTTTAYFY